MPPGALPGSPSVPTALSSVNPLLPLEAIASQVEWWIAATLADKWLQNPTNRAKYHLTDKEGLYYCNNRLVVPSLLRPQVLSMCHDSKSSAHFGITKTLHAIQPRFWWITWRQDVHSHVTQCLKCAKNKPRAHKPYGVLQPLPIPRSTMGFHLHAISSPT
jgi:hypothetical protein